MKIICAAFAAVLTVGLLAAPVAVSAQVRAKTPRLGLLGVLGYPERRVAAFYEELRALGCEEGKNLAIEVRKGPSDRLDQPAAELVQLNVDVIVTVGGVPRTDVMSTLRSAAWAPVARRVRVAPW